VLKTLFGVHGEEQSTTRVNLIANVLDGSFYAFGMSFVSLQTIIPVFVQTMGGTNVAVGLVPVLWTFGFNFPQILIVRHVQKLPWKKSLFMKTSFIQRVPWLLMSMVCFFLLEHVGTGIRLVLFFFFFLLTAIGGSLNLPVWFDLISKLTPVKIRGRMFAARSILGALLGIFGGALVTLILGSLSFPQNYGLLFLLAFTMMMVSYWFLNLLTEPVESPVRKDRERHYIEVARRILEGEANFRNFVVSDALIISSSMANAFFAVHAVRKFELSDAYAGVFTVVMMVSMIVGSILFGFLADRFGHKLNLFISAGATLSGSIIAILAPSLEVYLLVFVFSASTLAINMISRLPMVAELCPEEERPTYVALTNIFTSPFVLLGIVAGWLADVAGFAAVFLLAAAFALAAAYWLWARVKEPRRLQVFATENS